MIDKGARAHGNANATAGRTLGPHAPGRSFAETGSLAIAAHQGLRVGQVLALIIVTILGLGWAIGTFGYGSHAHFLGHQLASAFVLIRRRGIQILPAAHADSLAAAHGTRTPGGVVAHSTFGCKTID